MHVCMHVCVCAYALYNLENAFDSCVFSSKRMSLLHVVNLNKRINSQ